jgi:2-methylcitrate dehydratase PrpD
MSTPASRGGLLPGCTETTDLIARFVADTRLDDLPPETIERAKRSILDFLCVAIYGSTSECAEAYLSYATRQGSHPESTVVCGGRRLAAYSAALVNATYGHSTELFESYTRAMVHPGNVVIPAVLAVAERDGLSGAAVVTATAVGFEVLSRIGLSVGNGLLFEQGYHTPGALGGFGSTAGCATLVRLGAEQAADAVGIAACYVPSTLNAAMRGATIKEFFEGTAAATGVMATDLVRSGISGIRDWDEHWYRAVPRTHNCDELTDGLGKDWRIESGGLHFKERAVMAVGQPVLQACEALIRAHSLEAGSIARIRLRGGRRILVGGNRHPASILAAITSAPFLAAFAFVHQEEFLDDPHFIRCLTPERLADERVTALAERVEVEADERFDYDFEIGSPQRFAAHVAIELQDGTVFEEYADIWPATSQMCYDKVAQKFRDVVRDLVAPEETDRIVEHIARLDEDPDISAFLGSLGDLGASLRAAGSHPTI